tara:strand:+ start:667 stop:1164 length:498 start_codon:yes stop_codon:yes gene_type:complete
MLKYLTVQNLLGKAYIWARSVNASQQLTSGIWLEDWSEHEKMKSIWKLQLEQSDVIYFHNYNNAEDFEKRILWLQRYDRPILCTKYMARSKRCTFEDFLPAAKKYNVAMFNWGLVDGKTQTKYPWDSWIKTYNEEPTVRFHEVFKSDGTPYRKAETELIKKLTAN